MTKFEFYVLNYNPYEKKVENYNIFNNFYVNRRAHELAELFVAHKISFDEVRKGLDDICRSEFWGLREYEILVSDAFVYDISRAERWDCYAQVLPNLDTITHMIIEKTFEDMYGVDYDERYQ